LAKRKQQAETESNNVADQTAKGDQESGVQDPAAMWKELFQTLVAEAQLAETALAQLAEARASAVLEALQGTAGLPQHRIMLKPAKVLKPGKTPRVKLMLEPLQVKREKKTESQPE